ncbi:MAG TPA: 2-dehydropantoate 2-reductase N-terminal domain-containing protein [Ilumatobacteraceae bacterium]|nr:2-dehydropantoate 2-reductase N-terminal domain-containing protein [Ilumatobacteraceae bacterium]
MRVIIYGAGAVGSVIGGRLRQGAADVVLVARPAHAAAIHESGLALRTARGTEVIDIDVVTSIDQLAPTAADVVLITAKTQDTPAIHSELLDWNAAVPVVCATNGVEHERMALRRFPRVYGMVVQLPAQFERAGEVTVLCAPVNAILDVGRYPIGVDETAVELAALLDASPGISCEADDNVMTKKYGKLLVNLGNAADAACGIAGRGARVVAAAIEEGKRAYGAAGIRWEQSPERAELYKPRAAQMQFDIPAGDTFLGGSTWQSLMKGATSLETDYFNGEILLLARLHGLPAPANEFLQRYAIRMLQGEVVAGSLTTDELDAEWDDTVSGTA